MRGSFHNRMYENATNQPVPVVGMGATELCYTDRHPYTITRVSPSGKTFEATQDTATRTDTNGMSECQKYEFTPDPNGRCVTVRLTKRGWRSKGTGFLIGMRMAYHDYSF